MIKAKKLAANLSIQATSPFSAAIINCSKTICWSLQFTLKKLYKLMDLSTECTFILSC